MPASSKDTQDAVNLLNFDRKAIQGPESSDPTGAQGRPSRVGSSNDNMKERVELGLVMEPSQRPGIPFHPTCKISQAALVPRLSALETSRTWYVPMYRVKCAGVECMFPSMGKRLGPLWARGNCKVGMIGVSSV